MKIIYLIKKYIYIYILFLFLFFLLIFDLFFLKYPYSHSFFIKPNQTLEKITNNLYKEAVIDNKFFFKSLIKLIFAEKKLKAGEYNFANNNIFQIIIKIKEGKSVKRKIIIPEGLTSLEIIEILEKTDGVIINDYNSINLIEEGTLFPSTYFYAYGTNSNIIINNMKKEMDKILNSAWKNRDKNLKLKNHKEVLVLASLIEKETSLDNEKSMIAQVFLNRLKLNMKLQSDPTVIYGIEKKLGVQIKELKKQDLKFESKFNTYLNYGIPEGPICNPGKESIVAVTNPSKGDLLYFVANGSGGHNFSSNYNDHLKNIKKLREINKEHYEK